MLFGKIVLGVVGTAVAGVGLLCSDGLIEVKVVERQPETHHVYVIAPAMLVPIGMHFAPRKDLSRAAAQIQPWMPTVRAALDQLRDSDDITLVEVKEPGEHVRVAKEGGSIVVDVEDRDETVHVSTPIRAISSTIEQLAASAPSI
ncbi:MAG TPA: hypothetical protein VN861_18470 [Candidatus Acidoferrales bacterium]|nr:hypothetical protein [Candidatus Acidoferrales bacterium]